MQTLHKLKTQTAKILKKVQADTGDINPVKLKNIAPMTEITKKNSITILASIILVFVTAMPMCLAACSTPKLSFGDIVISEGVETNTNIPVNPKSEFDMKAKQIFATIKYSGVTGSGSWRFKWIYVETGEVILDDSKKYNEAQPGGYFQGIIASNIYISDDSKIIPAGKYKVEFYYNEEMIKTADFNVKEPQMKILEAVTSNEIDERGNPVSSIVQFKSTDTAYVSVKTDYLVAGHTIRVIWKKSNNSLIKEESINIKDNYYEPSYLGFSLELSRGENSEKPVTPGKYRVEIYLDDELEKTLNFEVIKEAPATFEKGATYSNEAFGFKIAVPDNWTYEEKADNNMITLTLKPAVTINAAFGFIATTAEPLKPFDDFAKKGAESFAKDSSWTLVDSKSRDYKIKNGTSARELSYLYRDKNEAQYVIAYSFIEYNGNAYILHIASDNAIYGDMALSVYSGILNSLVFNNPDTAAETTQGQ
jgi:hypothetical protein